MTMQWTEDLNALLNQCVFASGYDFEVSVKLFCEQATKLRLWTESRLELTANQCQEQWMALNPTEEGCEEEEGEDGDEPQLVVCPEEQTEQFWEYQHPQTSATPSLSRDSLGHNDSRQNQVDTIRREEMSDIPDVGPRLELSLSEAELDQLLSTLPPSDVPSIGPEGIDVSNFADPKDCHLQSSIHSEMQWVLAFLNDPDAIARVDAEAKNLMSSPGKHEDDDNYQVFLQGLHDANLMVPEQMTAVETKVSTGRQCVQQGSAGRVHSNDTGDESDSDSADEWELTRQAIKYSLHLR